MPTCETKRNVAVAWVHPAEANYFRRMDVQERTMNRFTGCLVVIGAMAALPAGAVSLATTGPAQPLPDEGMATVSLPIAENLVAGSASLVPLMAAELPAQQI